VLILDEPGNHLDVDTVDALADALLEYQGTVIFTSHDRHFTNRIATAIIEVRDGGVTNYTGNYESYVYRVNKEVDEGERETAAARTKMPANVTKATAKPARPRRTEKEIRKEMKALERTIAQLDEQKRTLTAQMMAGPNAAETLRLHNEIAALTAQLDPAEERWLELQAEADEV
jgi:ATP-binding cassette subfamily F protein 3